jgi:ATP-dependent Clp protease protease subunit
LSGIEIYATFTGNIDNVGVQRLMDGLVKWVPIDVPKLHLAIHTNGGEVGAGIFLYNFWKGNARVTKLYNCGNVLSIGVIAFLGAAERVVSRHGAFMIHRTWMATPMATANNIPSIAAGLSIDDARTERILRDHIELPPETWERHKYADVWLSAEDAVSAKLANSVEEFSPPLGTRVLIL